MSKTISVPRRVEVMHNGTKHVFEPLGFYPIADGELVRKVEAEVAKGDTQGSAHERESAAYRSGRQDGRADVRPEIERAYARGKADGIKEAEAARQEPVNPVPVHVGSPVPLDVSRASGDGGADQGSSEQTQ